MIICFIKLNYIVILILLAYFSYYYVADNEGPVAFQLWIQLNT